MDFFIKGQDGEYIEFDINILLSVTYAVGYPIPGGLPRTCWSFFSLSSTQKKECKGLFKAVNVINL